MNDRLKQVLRPVAEPLLTRLEHRLGGRIADLAERVDSLQAAVADLQGYLPAVLDTIESRNASDRETARAIADIRSELDRVATVAARPTRTD